MMSKQYLILFVVMGGGIGMFNCLYTIMQVQLDNFLLFSSSKSKIKGTVVSIRIFQLIRWYVRCTYDHRRNIWSGCKWFVDFYIFDRILIEDPLHWVEHQTKLEHMIEVNYSHWNFPLQVFSWIARRCMKRPWRWRWDWQWYLAWFSCRW